MNMEEVKNLILTCVLILLTTHLGFAQQIQDKIHIVDGICYIAQVDGLMGQIQYGSIDSLNILEQEQRLFWIGLLKSTGYSIKYTIFEEKAFAASFKERNGRFISGPTILSIDIASGFSLINESASQRYLELSGKTTYHLGEQIVFLDGQLLKKALFNSNFKRLVHDFVANDQGLFLMVHEQERLQIWKLLSKGEELLNLGKGIKSIQEENEKHIRELFLETRLAGEISRISSFSLNNELYLFIHDQGQIFQVAGTEIKLVATNLESDTSYLAYALVVDRDQDRIYLLPKQKLKEEKGSFNEMIRKIGIEIELD